jgi:hypothetical protein
MLSKEANDVKKQIKEAMIHKETSTNIEILKALLVSKK